MLIHDTPIADLSMVEGRVRDIAKSHIQRAGLALTPDKLDDIVRQISAIFVEFLAHNGSAMKRLDPLRVAAWVSGSINLLAMASTPEKIADVHLSMKGMLDKWLTHQHEDSVVAKTKQAIAVNIPDADAYLKHVALNTGHIVTVNIGQLCCIIRPNDTANETDLWDLIHWEMAKLYGSNWRDLVGG